MRHTMCVHYSMDGTVDISPSARLFIKESAIVQALYDGLKLLLDAEKAAAPAEA